MKLPAPRALIFDWDNTLVDTWPVIHRAINETFSALGKQQWTLDDTKTKVRKSMRDSFPEIFGQGWEKAGKVYQEQYRSHHLNMLTPLPGAAELLALGKKLGLPMAVVSNKKNYNLKKEAEHLKWEQWFEALIGSEDAARDKPHPDPVHLALEYLDMEPGPDIWFIGDSEIDLETAAACGCTAILFGDFAVSRPEFSPTHYHGFPYAAHVHDHSALTEILLSNSGHSILQKRS